MPVGPQQLRHRGRSPGAAGVDHGQCALCMGPHHAELEPCPGDPLPDHRAVRRAVGLCHLHDVFEFAREAHLLAERAHTPLELEQTHRHFPALTGFADDKAALGGGVVEEHLVELGGAGELLDRPDRDAGLIERHEEKTQSLVTRGPRLGAAQHKCPLGDVCQRRPDLLAVDDPLVAVECGGGGDVRQVRPRARFGITLRPQLVDRGDARQKTLFLFLGPERDQRRAQQFLAHVADPGRRARPRVLLMKDDALLDRRVAAAVFHGPAEARPSRGGQQPVPREPRPIELVFAARAAA